jgi:hypothetical protein
MTMATRVFRWAGIYGAVALLPMYFMEGRIGRDFPPAITHPEHFYGFVGVALAWQWVFLIIAKDPERFRPLMPAAVLEKLAFGLAAVVLFAQQRVAGAVLALGCVDLMWAALFVAAWRRTPKTAAVPERGIPGGL